MSARVRIRAALCLALTLANSGPAIADVHAYRWLDQEGRVHITATPPPDGARPAPDPEPSAAPAAPRDRFQVVPETGAAAPSPAEPVLAPAPEPTLPTPPVPAAAAAPDADPCAKFAKEVSAWVDARRKVARLEAQIERIESNPVQATTSEVCPRDSPCFQESFVRDEELRKANEALASAEERVGDLEEAAHKASVPDRCLVDPND